MSPSITTLFVDVGGVLLTNAWDHIARHRAGVRHEPKAAAGNPPDRV
jgi:hypothetical protein